MSLQTNVFENGRWITRIIDPYRIRAQNMASEHQDDNLSPRPTTATMPSLGLLTKTLARSSVIKWIIPARIRHQCKDDVLFFTTDCVTVKEALGNYTLRHVGVKADFDSPIRAAKIIGDPRELTRHNEYGYIQRSDDWEQEDVVEFEKRALPPQIAVLVLMSQKLIFLCADNRFTEELKWTSSCKELPTASSPMEQLGEHIAVDPKSRMIAIAATEGRAYIYELKSMKQMRQEFEEDSIFAPVKEERFLPNLPKGVILKMEFLHPSPDDDGRIVLLLLISVQGRSQMLWYEWKSGISLRIPQLKPKVFALNDEEQLPLLLIPLKLHFVAYMLVCEKCISLYRDILTGNPRRYVQQLDAARNLEESGGSKKWPLWVQWARPMRTPSKSFDDAIYLCREDGMIQYLELHNSLNHMLDSTHPAGRLGINVNKAFAILDIGPTTDDLVIAGGDMSEGGLWHVNARTDPTRVARVYDWTPLSDFTIIKPIVAIPASTESDRRLDQQPRASDRVFACSGRGEHGAISELRYGVEASKKSRTVDLGDEVNSGVLDMWAFHGYYGESGQQHRNTERWKDVTYVLISLPTQTSLLRLQTGHIPNSSQLRNPELLPDPDAELVTEDLGLEYDTRTIAAAVIPGGLMIQVTENSIRATNLLLRLHVPEHRWKEVQSVDQRRYVHRIEHSRILAASIYTHGVPNDGNGRFEHTYLLLALQARETFDLQLGQLSEEYHSMVSCMIPLQPSCLLLRSACGYLLAFVATLDGRLRILKADEEGQTLHAVCEFDFKGSFAICDSLTILNSVSKNVTQLACLVVCGLRNGSVVTLSLNCNDSWELFIQEEFRLGHVSANVMSDSTVVSRALVHCGEMFCALEYRKDMEPPAIVNRIWITDADQPVMQTGALSVVTQAVTSWVPGDKFGLLAGCFFCVDGDLLHIVSIEADLDRRIVPRRLKLGIAPFRVIHSQRLNKLVVIGNGMTAHSEPIGSALDKRSLHSSINFLDPDYIVDIKPDPDEMDITQGGDKQSTAADDHEDIIRAEQKKGERFLGITEWTPKISSHTFHMLIVNTIISTADDISGRLLIFAIAAGNTDTPKLVLKKRMDLDAPVYSVATYPEHSFVYCCGSDLYMQIVELPDFSGRYKWLKPIRANIRSPGRHLTVREPLIYISSAQESLAVFKYEDNRLVYQFGDQSVRDGLHHVFVPEYSLVLASDMRNSVIGLWQPPDRRIDNIMPTVFEAILTGSITRLHRITRPIWYEPLEDEVMTDALIGSSMDGTVIQFVVVNSGWRLLRFIQNLAERNPLICPYSKPPRKKCIEPATAKAIDMHIDGNIIQRLLDRDGEQLLLEMMDAEPELGSATDFENTQMRWARFVELAKEVADEKFKKRVEEAGNVWDETWAIQWVAMTMRWVRYQLRSVL